MLDLQPIALTFATQPGTEDRKPITLDPDYSIKGLVAAVIIQAMRDASRGDPQAREWLSWDGLLWAEAAGFNADETIKEWITAGCQMRNFPKKKHSRVKAGAR